MFIYYEKFTLLNDLKYIRFLNIYNILNIFIIFKYRWFLESGF